MNAKEPLRAQRTLHEKPLIISWAVARRAPVSHAGDAERPARSRDTQGSPTRAGSWGEARAMGEGVSRGAARRQEA